MSNKVTTPYPLFSDIDGSPLNAGFLFLGETEKDAEQFPISVYWDEEKTEIASQPLQTKNGFIVRNNTPAKIFIDDGACSITIKNRSNTIVQQVLTFDQMSSVNGVKALINTEKSRAETAEDVLDEKINTTATNLTQTISSETTRATAAEANLQSQINANGVGNKAYLTYSAMDADKANIPAKSKVTVTNDPDQTKNGDYQWDGTVFTKSTYDPLTQAKADATTKANTAESNAKTYADQVSTAKVQEVAIITGSNDFLEGHIDKNGQIYLYIKNDGHIIAVDLEQSIQKEINTLKTTTSVIGIESGDTDLFKITDAKGNLVAKVDKASQLWLTGLNNPVQYYLLGQQDLNYTSPKSFKTKADLFNADVVVALESNISKAPIGRGLLEQQYHLGTKWIKNLSMSPSTSRIVIAAYNDRGDKTNLNNDSGVVHPNVIKFDEPVCGYKYWMGINPYTNTNEDFELPYIYGSNSDDLDNWTLIDSFPQPFDVDPENTGGVMSGHLSDSFFTYDPVNGELWFCWRQTLYYDASRDRTLAKQTFFGRKTKDGTNWSTEKLVVYPQYTLNNDTRYSPSIVYNAKDGLFYLYYITFAGALGCETSESLTNPNWKTVSTIQLPFIAWHLEMKWCGDALVALVHSDAVDQLYLGISRDMKTFEWNSGLFNAATNLYKSSFIPVFNDNGQISLKVVYTTDQNSSPMWQLHTTQTNFTSIED